MLLKGVVDLTLLGLGVNSDLANDFESGENTQAGRQMDASVRESRMW